jgi:hypothetical protein
MTPGTSEQADRNPDRATSFSRRGPHRPSLSVVLLSQGDRGNLERALVSIAGRCRRMEAEIIVVREALVDDARSLGAAYPSVTFLEAGEGCTGAQMRELGMTSARGDIVSIRMDGAVGDGLFLEAFGETVGVVEGDEFADVEVPLKVAVEQASTERRRTDGLVAPTSVSGPRRRADVMRAAAAGAARNLDQHVASVLRES